MTDLVAAARELLGADVRPLAGGYSGETFAVDAAGEQAVLRLYVRDPRRAGVDTALLRLVHGIIPVPRVLESRTVPNDDGPPYLLTERLSGVPLTELLASAEPAVRERAGHSVGLVLARLGGMPYPRIGWFDGPELTVRPWPDASDLPSWVEAHRTDGQLAGWTADEIAALVEIARDAQALLDTDTRVCLCHSDFNPKNLLVDPESGEVVGVLDWEFAHAGMPYADLGNLLRFETDEAFCRAAIASYAAHAPAVHPDFLELGRASDLLALVDLAAREQRHAVTDAAHDLLRRTIRAGELAAGRPELAGWAESAREVFDSAARPRGHEPDPSSS